MFEINCKKILRIRYSGGSSTLVLGDEKLARQFFSEIANHIYNTERISWHCPEVINYINPENILQIGSEKWLRNAGIFLESPREMLYQTLGKMIVMGGKLIFILGVTNELVEKFDNQNLISFKSIKKAKTKIECNEHEYSPPDEDEDVYEDEYVDEYPELDEFGNPNKISWLREYALRAEDFSRSQEADLFLNLKWNKSKDKFPTPFWLLFDRIYEIKNGNDGKVDITQIR